MLPRVIILTLFWDCTSRNKKTGSELKPVFVYHFHGDGLFLLLFLYFLVILFSSDVLSPAVRSVLPFPMALPSGVNNTLCKYSSCLSLLRWERKKFPSCKTLIGLSGFFPIRNPFYFLLLSKALLLFCKVLEQESWDGFEKWMFP